MVKLIREASGHDVRVTKAINWMVGIASHIPGKVAGLTNKAFGNMSYDQNMSKYDFKYQVVSFNESIKRTEG